MLHVINQKDPHWWQARREGEDDSQLPGLIPSASFQQQRESLKHTVAAQDAGDKYGTGAGGRMKRARTGFLCAKRASSARKNKGGGGGAGGGGGTYPKGGGHHNKGRTGPPFNEHDPERDPDAASTGTSAEDIIIYEEVHNLILCILRQTGLGCLCCVASILVRYSAIGWQCWQLACSFRTAESAT